MRFNNQKGIGVVEAICTMCFLVGAFIGAGTTTIVTDHQRQASVQQEQTVTMSDAGTPDVNQDLEGA